MATGVELRIQQQIDALASWRKAARTAVDGRTLLWAIAYAADDITYVNNVVGTPLYNLDLLLNEVKIGPQLQTWFNLHNAYFANDTPDFNSFPGALAVWKWRVSEYWSLSYHEAIGTRLDKAYVFPKDTLTLATYARTGSVFTAGDDEIDTDVSYGGLIGLEATSVIGVANWTVTATLTRVDATTVNLAVTLPTGSAVGTKRTFGSISLSGNAAADQPVVLIATTTPFKVGEPVVLQDNDGNSEYGIVESISAGVSITLTEDLAQPFLTADAATVAPVFTGVTAASQSLGTNGDTAKFVVIPDRPISLTYDVPDPTIS